MMEKEIKQKLYKRGLFTFIYTFIWMFALNLVLQFLQALGVFSIYVKPEYLTPLAIVLTVVITYLRMKRYIKNPDLLDE